MKKYTYVSIAFALAALFIPVSNDFVFASDNQTPVGNFEGVNVNGLATGWAVDPDTAETSISVHFYVDGPAGSGVYVGFTNADVPKSGVPYAGNHGFNFQIPNQYGDGNVHTVYSYGIDSSNDPAANVVLEGSPQTFNFSFNYTSITNGTMTVGVNLQCGGVLAQIKVNNGPNYINNFDCGRQVQTALYDGGNAYDNCAGCSGVWGWDPVQGGDRYGHSSVIVSQNITPTSIYIKTQPYEWYPDNKGGNSTTPVLSDVYIEQTITFVPGQSKAIQAHYKITHFGNDIHTNAEQEFPAFYTNLAYNNLVYYAGTAPWTNDTITQGVLPTAPVAPHPNFYSSELWAGLVDSQGDGFAVYFPGESSYFDGMTLSGTGGEFGSGANYFRPQANATFKPNDVLSYDLYFVAGNATEQRTAIYTIKNTYPIVDFTTPFGFIDSPLNNQTLTGIVNVNGWMLDSSSVSRVEVWVDGGFVGNATYGNSRPDILNAFPNATPNAGWSYPLNTSLFSNDTHTITIKAYDINNNVAILPGRTEIFSNTPVPVIVATDNFNRANSSTLGSHWTVKSGNDSLVIANNKIEQGSLVNNAARAEYWNANTFNANQYSQAKYISDKNSVMGLGVRINTGASNTYYYAYVSSNSAYRRIGKVVNGVDTILLPAPAFGAIHANDIIRLEVSGSTLTFKVNGVTKATVTDSSITNGAAGLTGFRASGASPVLDDWEGGNL